MRMISEDLLQDQLLTCSVRHSQLLILAPTEGFLSRVEQLKIAFPLWYYTMFCLTFFVTRFLCLLVGAPCTEAKVFRLQDYKQQRPSQELVAKDLHGVEWRFRHIYRGNVSNRKV